MYKFCSVCHSEMTYIKTLNGGYWNCKHCLNIDCYDSMIKVYKPQQKEK